MKKILIFLFSFFVGLSFTCSPVFPWGSATHAYIGDHIGKIFGLRNSNEIYGSMLPDLFNYMFELEGTDLYFYFRAHTHGFPGQEDFMKVWYKAKWWGYQKSIAYGFVSHNDVWGADSTAHYASRTLNPEEGWVVTKSKELEQLLSGSFDDIGLGGEEYYELRVELCHSIIETAGDIIIKRVDNKIGSKILLSAMFRTPQCPTLLINAIGEAYRDIIKQAENEFRKMMILYGQALMQDEDTAIELIAEQMANLAEEYLKNKGIELPSGIELKSLIEDALQTAISLIKDDYMKEVEATIEYIKVNLWKHRVFYF